MEPWVYELLGEVLEYEELHGAHREGWHCLYRGLENVPEQQKRDARVWQAAREHYQKEEADAKVPPAE